jgi:microcystin degradation protein MlrC
MTSASDAGRPLRAFTAGLGVETNTFTQLEVGMAAFRQTFLFGPGEHPDVLTEVSAPLYVLRRRREEKDWDLVEGTYAFALPAGRTERLVYEDLRDRILAQLTAAGPVDMVALSLHGAMCAIGYDDCEGDLLAHVRRVVGPGVPIGVEFDPHAHLTDAMVENADVLVAYKEYPHTDFLERGEELIDLLERSARTGWRPARAVFDCRMIGRFHTTREPMKALVAEMIAAEQRPGIASVSLVHGFPWGDVAEMGARFLVLGDRADEAAALAEALGVRLRALRHKTFTPAQPIDAGLALALAAQRGPVVLGDVSDNPGGGAPGDSTILLEQVLNARTSACLGPLWDPHAVETCNAAGLGARLQLSLGGRSGPGSGRPLLLDVEVTGLADEAFQSWAGTRMSLGRTCAVRSGDVSVVITSTRDQAYSPDLFEAVGVNPAAHRLVVVKSAQHFVAGFTGMAAEIILVSGGGPLETDFRKVRYRHVRRPMWPLDDLFEEATDGI